MTRLLSEPVMNWNNPPDGLLSTLPKEQLLGTEYFQNKKGSLSISILYTGHPSDLNVSVCCVDWNKKVVVGNAKFNSLSEIWNGPSINTIRKLHLERKKSLISGCKNCTYLHTAPDNIDCLAKSDCNK